MLTRDEVMKWVTYNPRTGELRWKQRAANNAPKGALCGNINAAGYREVRICGWRTYVHRVAFLIKTGSIPAYIDHRDTDRANNKWSNLRGCTQSQNLMNTRQRKSRSGVRGVEPTCSGFFARIKVNGERIYLGHFPDLESAAAAYKAAQIKYHGAFAPLTVRKSD